MKFFNLLNVFQVAKLTDDDAIAINNLRVLGGEPDAKKTSTSGFALKFDMHKVDVIYSLILKLFEFSILTLYVHVSHKLPEKACSKEKSCRRRNVAAITLLSHN
jgi:hypothetical protein